MVGYGLGQGLQELLLSLELPGHRACPPVALLRALRLAEEGEGGALPTGGLHPEHPIVRVPLHRLLKLHIVHLQNMILGYVLLYNIYLEVGK